MHDKISELPFNVCIEHIMDHHVNIIDHLRKTIDHHRSSGAKHNSL